MALEQVCGNLAKRFHRIATLDQGETFRDETLQFDRAQLGAVLVALALPLRGFIGVEMAVDACGGAMEQVDLRPEQIFEIGFEAGVGERRDVSVEHIGDSTGDEPAWNRGTGAAPVSEADADAYIQRQVKYDPDVWVLEIEDRKGQYKLDGKIVG